MEAISQGDNSPPPSEPTLYDRRVTDQRPKHLCPRLSILKTVYLECYNSSNFDPFSDPKTTPK